MPTVVQIRRKGVITLPAALRRRYALSEGDVYTLVDLGDGAFLLVPGVSQVARLGDALAQVLQQEGLSAEEVIRALDAERERYYGEHYVGDQTLL